MTDQDKNITIAKWVGEYTTHYTYELPDYTNTNASFDLLDELVKKGYEVKLTTMKSGSRCLIQSEEMDSDGCPKVHVMSQLQEPKSRAIVEAIILLIEKEKADGHSA